MITRFFSVLIFSCAAILAISPCFGFIDKNDPNAARELRQAVSQNNMNRVSKEVIEQRSAELREARNSLLQSEFSKPAPQTIQKMEKLTGEAFDESMYKPNDKTYSTSPTGGLGLVLMIVAVGILALFFHKRSHKKKS